MKQRGVVSLQNEECANTQNVKSVRELVGVRENPIALHRQQIKRKKKAQKTRSKGKQQHECDGLLTRTPAEKDPVNVGEQGEGDISRHNKTKGRLEKKKRVAQG